MKSFDGYISFTQYEKYFGEEIKKEKERQQMANLENAIADMKRQLAKESKNSLIRQWIGLYAQVIQLNQEIETLKKALGEKQTNTVASATEGE